jgi:hypothetical protein
VRSQRRRSARAEAQSTGDLASGSKPVSGDELASGGELAAPMFNKIIAAAGEISQGVTRQLALF